jgi:hypothetical protein
MSTDVLGTTLTGWPLGVAPLAGAANCALLAPVPAPAATPASPLPVCLARRRPFRPHRLLRLTMMNPMRTAGAMGCSAGTRFARCGQIHYKAASVSATLIRSVLFLQNRSRIKHTPVAGSRAMSDPSRPSANLCARIGELPNFVLAAWRVRYVIGENVDFRARAIINQEAAVVRSQGREPDARTIWLRLIDRMAGEGGSQELLAATSLAGLAAGLRPPGFEKPPERSSEADVRSS